MNGQAAQSPRGGAFKVVREYAILSLGILLYTIGWTLFLIPSKVVGGGSSGVGALVYFVSGIPVGYTYLAINAVLIIIAMRVVGKSFGFKTIYGVGLASLLLTLEQHIFTQGLLPDDMILISTIIGGALSGLGVALAISQGGSTGGTDIVAIIVTKYRNVALGRVVLFTDVVIISSAFLVLRDLEYAERIGRIVYGYITMAVSSYVIDAYMSGLKQSMQILIFSKHYERIADRITHDLNRGVTVIDGQGWYSKEEGKILLVVVRRAELSRMYAVIKQEDAHAFLSVGSVMGVYGRGFDVIKK